MGAVSRHPTVAWALVGAFLHQTPALIESPSRGSGRGESDSNPSPSTNFQTDVDTANCHEDEPPSCIDATVEPPTRVYLGRRQCLQRAIYCPLRWPHDRPKHP